jgi:hypothetical protein
MAQSSWPFENIDTTETQFSQWARNIGEGIRPNAGDELEPFADNTGLNVKVRSGESLVRGHYYKSTAVETLTITAADPTHPRIDAVVLELDPVANSILLKVVAGTAEAVPTPPTLTQTDGGIWQQLLAYVAVDNNVFSIEAGDVTDERTFLVPFTGTLNAKELVTNVSDKSANYGIQASDANSYIRSTGSAITITVTDVLANGESVNFIQAGAGQITFSGLGVTINSVDGKLKTNKQYSGATITKLGGAYYLVGDLGA